METVMENKHLHIYRNLILVILCLMLVLLGLLSLASSTKTSPVATAGADAAIMDSFDSMILGMMDEAQDAVLMVPKRFWLSKDATKGPVPDPEKYGSTDDPSTLQWLLDDAQTVLEGQDTYFSTDVKLMPGSVATYYLDESIFAITWKQVIDGCVYTVSEIKVTHPSQFRRHLEGGVFDGPSLSTPTLMSRSVNAVVGSAADHYRGRRAGIIVYDGTVQRVNAEYVDTCYINDDGDLLFSYKGELGDKESAQKFVDENNIRFSLAFGPVIMDNGEKIDYHGYALGEVYGNYARSALCQMGPLHYLLIVCAREGRYDDNTNMRNFQNVIASFGCDKAYALDGGQTAVIAMQGKPINRVSFGYQRQISDIIYFATAIPDGE